jgi:hypothetical protein
VNAVAAGDVVTFVLYPHGATAPELARTTVVGIAAQLEIMNATPNPVPVPYLGGPVPYHLAWNTPGFAQVDGYASKNGAAFQFIGGGASPGGSDMNAIDAGDRVVFVLYPKGTTSPELARTTVTGLALPQPEIWATPNPVTVPAGQTAASYTLSWNSAGYDVVDGWAQKNGGAWTFVGAAPTPGSNDVNSIGRGDTVLFVLYPHGATSPELSRTVVTGR